MEQSSKQIFFVGDSYCNSYDKRLQSFQWARKYQKHDKSGTTYPSIVARHFGYKLHCHGYGGHSWWYSRHRFLEDILKLSPVQTTLDIQAIIFCHTDHRRINNGQNETLPHLIQDQCDDNFKYYWTEIYEDGFNRWAQEQWFHEIYREYRHIKTLHFFSMGMPDDFYSYNILPGMVFTTPLIYASVGELEGTDEEVMAKCVNDDRPNHFSTQNNQILAQIIIEALENYQPGKYELDLDRFYRVNKNNTRWPHPGFGTK